MSASLSPPRATRPAARGSGTVVALSVVATVVAGAAAVLNPTAGVAAVALLVVGGLALLNVTALPRMFVASLGVTLAGYAYVGKSFAYLGAPPLFVGEMVLACGLLALFVRGGPGEALRFPLVPLIALLAFWCAAQTLPYLPTYRIDALRDAALWGYAIFALLVATMLTRMDLLGEVPRQYTKWFWWLPFWLPITGIAARVAADRMPHLPGTQIPLLLFKPGDAAVHLAGAAAFVLLGLHAPYRNRPLRGHGGEWLWWAGWLAAFAVAVSGSRGGFLSIAVAMFVVLALRPNTKVWKPTVVGIMLGLAFWASRIEIDLGLVRKVSAEQLASNLLSIVNSESERQDLEGTREWRLQWWDQIVGYTVHGPYFWTGKGFGVNLANDDGYQGTTQGNPNRSPHNVQITFLARAGVPGAVIWLTLQAAFVAVMLRGYFGARRLGADRLAAFTAWVLAYWLACLVNATFDVYLEGPQGGIWYWSLMGAGLAALHAQRALRGPARPPQLDGAGQRRRRRPQIPAIVDDPHAPRRPFTPSGR